MCKLLAAGLITALALTVSAQDTNPQLPSDFKPVKVTKTKITCKSDMHEKIKPSEGDAYEQVTKGKTSESIRTTWSNGAVEYRFSDANSFNENGKVFSNLKVFSKVETKKEGNQVTEKIQMRQVVRYLDEEIAIEGGNLQQRDFESISIFQVNGAERTLIASVVDGKAEPTNGAREVEVKLDEKRKVVLYTEKTPYTIEYDGLKIEVLKSEMNCLFEEIE